jgi:hypothetical protein
MANPYITQASPMVGQTLIDPESQALQRQKQYAAALLQQNQQPQGQMIGGRFVAPSITQQLSSALNPLLGAYMLNQADTKQTQLAEALREQGDKDLMAYGQAVTPKPAVEGGIYGPDNKLTTQTTADMYGANMELNPQYKEVAAQAAVEPDFAKGMRILRSSKDPETRQLAKLLMADQMKTLILPEGSTAIRGSLFGSGGQTVQGAPKVGQDLKDAAREAKLDINNINSWSPQDWTKVRAIEANTANFKRPTNVVNIPNFTEKTFAGTLAENQAKKFDTLQATAEKAPDVLRSVAESRKILNSGKFFSGTPANVQLEMAKMADALNLGGADTKEKAANTQTLITNAAGTTLDSIAGSGLGAGQGFTDKDLKFLQEAKSFRIDMTDTNIRRVIDLQERAAKASVGRYNERLRSLPQSSIQQMGLKEIVLPRTADEIVKE